MERGRGVQSSLGERNVPIVEIERVGHVRRIDCVWLRQRHLNDVRTRTHKDQIRPAGSVDAKHAEGIAEGRTQLVERDRRLVAQHADIPRGGILTVTISASSGGDELTRDPRE